MKKSVRIATSGRRSLPVQANVLAFNIKLREKEAKEPFFDSTENAGITSSHLEKQSFQQTYVHDI